MPFVPSASTINSLALPGLAYFVVTLLVKLSIVSSPSTYGTFTVCRGGFTMCSLSYAFALRMSINVNCCRSINNFAASISFDDASDDDVSDDDVNDDVSTRRLESG